MAKKKSARNLRREARRAGEKLLEKQRKLARLEPGGTPERAIAVASASSVEPRALAHGCVACGGAGRVVEHEARTAGERRLRIVTLRCSKCGATRRLYFTVESATMN